MKLIQRKPKTTSIEAVASSPVEQAVREMRKCSAGIAECEALLTPLRDAQKRAHQVARGGPKANTDDASLSVAAADYFLGKSGREAVDAALAETAAVESAGASEQQAAALAIAELDRRMRPIEQKRDSLREQHRDASFRALHAYAAQLDAERMTLMRREADLLAEIYAVADLMTPMVQPSVGRSPIAAPSYMRPREVEILPTGLLPVGQYATFLDEKRLAAAKESVAAELRIRGVLE